MPSEEPMKDMQPNVSPTEVVKEEAKPQTFLADKVMEKIHTEKTEMKPRWYFVMGSAALFSGVAILFSLSAYLVSFLSFFFRTHGPRAEMRFNILIATFPWWALLLALLSIALGVALLRRYDFSYKTHFWPVVVGLLLAVLAAGYIMNYFGLDRPLMQHGPMRGMYERFDGRKSQKARGPWLERDPAGEQRGMMRGGGMYREGR